MKIFIFTKRSLFLIFLVSNTFNPLVALPHTYEVSKQASKINKAVYTDIKNILISKGLQKNIAARKVDKLFAQSRNAPFILSRLCSDENLMLSKNKIVETLAKYALFEKQCNLDSYESLVALIQHVKVNLSKKELAAIQEISNFG